MKERPILFNAEMVRAVLDGRKTQTRRVMKQQPEMEGGVFWWPCHKVGSAVNMDEVRSLCPYGVHGDRLWVRETWRVEHHVDHMKPSALNPLGHYAVDYLADDTSPEWAGKTRPSIFMPRWASRINLEVTAVRVERVREITPRDAKAEGDKERSGQLEYCERGEQCHVDWFRCLWDEINTKRGYPWKSNPWVWVVEFKRI